MPVTEGSEPGALSPARRKRQLRARIRAQRAGMSAGERAAAAADLLRAAELAGLVRDSIVAGYLANPSEPDVTPILEAAAGVLVPIPRADRRLAWASSTGGRARHGHLPVDVPTSHPVGVGARGLLDQGVTTLLVPALAIGRDGARLGQGGGFYDQLLGELAAAPEPPGGRALRIVAVVFAGELLGAGEIPLEPHDWRVPAVLTPEGLLGLGKLSRGAQD